MKKKKQNNEQMKRVHKQSFMLNAPEMRAFDRYCRKYKVKNKSRFLRETIFTAILKKFDEDHPTLFETGGNHDLFTASE